MQLSALTDSTWKQKPLAELSCFADVFYAYDFNKPKENYRLPFIYNHNRHNQFNLNLGYVKLGVQHSKYRVNLAVHTGTYSHDNYAAEPGLVKNIFEANAGISLSRKNNWWIDAGVFGSHIGFESAVSLDNLTLTRSLLAENSPYYLTGAKLTYTPTVKWEVAAIICNGWQRIQPVKGNSLPSFGTQLKFTPTEKATINWSTFIGTDDPDSGRRMRYFSNLYTQLQLTKRLELIAGFDAGIQQTHKSSKKYNYWLSPVVIARYKFSEHWATALRVEYYADKAGVIIASSSPEGFDATGLSLNFDYLPVSFLACRMEGRWLYSSNKNFERSHVPVHHNFALLFSIALRVSQPLFKK
ncbi:MAG: porin [Chitinophagales bacterium]|nr:porin [Chitinophagales bacterium]